MKRLRLFNIWILLGGMFTSVMTLALMGYLSSQDFNLMGMYVWRVVPVGAILAGIISGLGYAIASRLSNVKVRFEFFIIIVFGGVATFLFSHLVIYYLTSRDMTFLDYIRDRCEGMALYNEKTKQTSGPVGGWGYLYQSLQMLGFSFAALVPVLILLTLPYCEHCQVYLSNQGTHSLSSELKQKAWKSVKKPEKRQVLVNAIQQVTQAFYDWYTPLQFADGDTVEEAHEQLDAKPAKKSLATVQVKLYRCSECDAWELIATLVNTNVKGGINHSLLVDTNTNKQPKVPTQPQPPPLPPSGGEPGSTHIQE